MEATEKEGGALLTLCCLATSPPAPSKAEGGSRGLLLAAEIYTGRMDNKGQVLVTAEDDPSRMHMLPKAVAYPDSTLTLRMTNTTHPGLLATPACTMA